MISDAPLPARSRQLFSNVCPPPVGVGFVWSWDSVYRITEVSSVNFCNQFLQLGDRILKVAHSPCLICVCVCARTSVLMYACMHVCCAGVHCVCYVHIVCRSGCTLTPPPPPGEQHRCVTGQTLCHEEAAEADQQTRRTQAAGGADHGSRSQPHLQLPLPWAPAVRVNVSWW